MPLVFELGIVFTLLLQSQQLEAEIAREKQAKIFLNTATEAVRTYFRLGISLTENTYYATMENFQKYYKDFRNLPEVRQQMKSILPSIPSYRKLAEKLIAPLKKLEEEHLGYTVDILLQRQIMQMVPAPETFTDELDTRMIEILEYETGVAHTFANNYNDKVMKLLIAVKGAQSNSPKKQEKMRAEQKTFLFVAMATSVVLALQLAYFFVTSIVSRLLTITDNTIRLKDERQLNPPLGGKDEIGLLDSVFHEMSRALKESREKERQMLDKLMVAEARVRTIIENMPVGIVILNEAGEIESVNPRVEELFGHDSESLIDSSFAALFEAADESSKVSLLEKLAQVPGKKHELLALKSEGERFYAELVANEIQTFEGKRLLVSIQDVTERHELERVKQEFYAMIAHDLRSPLMSTHLSIGLALDGILGDVSEKVSASLKRADIGLKRLTTLINDFLDYEKLQAGKFDLKLEPVQMSSLMAKAASELKGLADKCVVRVEIQETNLEAVADEERLIQVLINFLSNALKYAPENSTVCLKAEKTEKAQIKVSVIDQGPGIPAELKEKLFKSYSMLKTQPSRSKMKGTGLGLAISKMIVEQHGGEIGVESEAGKGSCFWFKIPLNSV